MRGICALSYRNEQNTRHPMKHKCVGGQTGTPEESRNYFTINRKYSDERTLHCYMDPSSNDYRLLFGVAHYRKEMNRNILSCSKPERWRIEQVGDAHEQLGLLFF